MACWRSDRSPFGRTWLATARTHTYPTRVRVGTGKWRAWERVVSVWTLAALLATTTHYLAHFHFASGARALPAAALGYEAPIDDTHGQGHSAERCGLCLQLDRLPAPPAQISVPAISLVLIARSVPLPSAQRRSVVSIWQPPLRGPPAELHVV
jgi:hypothetical protein